MRARPSSFGGRLRAGLGIVLLAAPAAAQCEVQRLEPAAAVPLDSFGEALALEGTRVLVAAPGSGASAGVVHELDRQGESWVEVDAIVDPGGAGAPSFGRALALSGDRALVGDPLQDGGETGEGAAYFFDRTGSGWVPAGELHGQAQDQGLGLSVALAGDTALVLDSAAGPTGVYERQGTQWVRVDELPSDSGPVVLDGNRALTRTASGVEVHLQTGGSWNVEDALVGSDTVPGDDFGADFDLVGTRAVVLAPLHDGAGTDAGAAYFFERTPSGWIQRTRILPPDFLAAGFGSVAIHGTYALIGKKAGADGLVRQGAYLCVRTGGGWNLIADLQPLGTAGFASIPQAGPLRHDLDGDTILLGLPFSVDDPGSVQNQGAVSAWSLAELGCPPLFAVPSAISLAAGGTQHMKLVGPPSMDFHLYWILGAATGTSPGQPAGGGFTIPLNFDQYYLFTVLSPNTLIPGSLNFLDGSAEAAVQLTLPPGLSPTLAGVTMNHAYILIDVFDTGKLTYVSNPQPLALTP